MAQNSQRSRLLLLLLLLLRCGVLLLAFNNILTACQVLLRL